MAIWTNADLLSSSKANGDRKVSVTSKEHLRTPRLTT